MISLQKYISSELETNITINSELEQHFYCEFVLQESFKFSYFNILEKYGSYIGQKELIIDLAKEIYLTIKNKEPENTFELNKSDLEKYYDTLFFDKLIVKFDNYDTAYIANKSHYDEKTKIFDIIFIKLCPNEYNTYTSITSALMHEMLHAYNHYQSYFKNSKFKLTDLTNKKSRYYKTLITDNEVSVRNVCKRIINNISQWEQNAYINELSIELENNKFDFSKYNNINTAYKAALKIFQNSDVWIQYSTLWNYIINLQYNGSEIDKTEFADTYNEINNTKLTYNKIYKKLNGVFNKILSHMETNVPKLFYQYYKEQLQSNGTISQRQNEALIKFIEFENTYLMLESVKPANGLEWEVYFNGKLDTNFIELVKKWKKHPQVGKGWYAGGIVFKIVKIENNKVYTEEDKDCN